MSTRPVAFIVSGFVACATMLQTAAAQSIPFSLNLTTTNVTLTTATSVCGTDPICANFSGPDFSIHFDGDFSLPSADVGAPLSSLFPDEGPGWLGLQGSGTVDISGTPLDLFRGMFFLIPPASGTVPAGYATLQIPLSISFEAVYCVDGVPTICDAGNAFSNVDGLLTMNFTPLSADTESFGFTFTDVPEPSGVLLLLIGLAGLLIGKRILSFKAHNVREID